MSAPMALGILGVLSVGLADTYFLGRLGGEELAAVGFIYPVTTAVTSLSIGLSAGANAALSQSLGRGDDRRTTSRLAFHALGLATVLSVAVALGFWLGSGPLFGALGASGAVAEAVAAYAPVWALSFPFLVSMMVLGAVFRAHGDGGTAATVMLLAAGVNIALDPLLIFGWGFVPGLGMEGAAWATVAGRAAGLALSLWLVRRRGLLCRPDRLFGDLGDSARQVGRVGGPAAFSNAINPAGMAAVTAAVATLGDAAVAGFGAATRVQSVALVPLLALSSGIGPVVGQNWGAERADRARRAVRVTFGFCAAYGLAVALVLFFLGGPIAGLIAPGTEAGGSAASDGAAEYGARYLRVVGWSLFGYGVLVTANAAMNARGVARRPLHDAEPPAHPRCLSAARLGGRAELRLHRRACRRGDGKPGRRLGRAGGRAPHGPSRLRLRPRGASRRAAPRRRRPGVMTLSGAGGRAGHRGATDTRFHMHHRPTPHAISGMKETPQPNPEYAPVTAQSCIVNL